MRLVQSMLCTQQSAGGMGFGKALLAEIDINPPGESIFFVPQALPVPYEYKFVHTLILSAEGQSPPERGQKPQGPLSDRRRHR